MSTTKLSAKLSAAAATGAAFAATSAEAGVVQSTTLPVSLSLIGTVQGDSVGWDVDGDGNVDFRLLRGSNHGFTTSSQNIFLDSAGLNGRGWLNLTSINTDNFTRLAGGQVVGPGGVFGSTGAGSRNLLYQRISRSVTTYTTNYTSTIPVSGTPSFITTTIVNTFTNTFTNTTTQVGYDFNGGLPGDNFAGFRFLINGNEHYGYAVININLATQTATLVSAFYNDEAGAAITIGVIPEPGSGLALLAAGAAGLGAFRRRRAAANV